MNIEVSNFKIWKFVLFFIGMTVVSAVLSLLFLQDTDRMQAQQSIELLLNGSLTLYIYWSIRKGNIPINGTSMTQAMSGGRWAKYIGATLFIKVFGVIVTTIIGLLLFLSFPPILHFLHRLIEEETRQFITPTAFQFVLMVISLCILTPIWEEFFFRGILFRRFAIGTNTMRAAIYSSLIFGILHIGGSSMFHAFLVGMLFCYIYASTQNIWVPVILHSMGNLLSLLPILFSTAPYENIYLPSQKELKGELSTLLFPLLLCMVVGVILLRKYGSRLRKMTIARERERQAEGKEQQIASK